MILIKKYFALFLSYSLLLTSTNYAQTIPAGLNSQNLQTDTFKTSSAKESKEIKEKLKQDFIKLGDDEDSATETARTATSKFKTAKTQLKDLNRGSDEASSNFDLCTFNSNQDNWNDKSTTAKQAHAVFMGLWAAYNSRGKLGQNIFKMGGNGRETFSLNQKLSEIGEKYKKINDELMEKFAKADQQFSCHCKALKTTSNNSISSGSENKKALDEYKASCGGIDENPAFAEITKIQDAEAAAKRHREMLISFLQTQKELQAQQMQNFEEIFMDLNQLIISVQEQDYQSLIGSEQIRYPENTIEKEKLLEGKRGLLVGEYSSRWKKSLFGIISSEKEPKNFMGNLSISNTRQVQVEDQIPQNLRDTIERCEETGYDCDNSMYEEMDNLVTTETEVINPSEKKILFSNWIDAQLIDEEKNPIQFTPLYFNDNSNFISLISKNIRYHSVYFTPSASDRCTGENLPNLNKTNFANGNKAKYSNYSSITGVGNEILAPGNFCANEIYKIQEEGINHYLLDPPFPPGYSTTTGADVRLATNELTRCIIQRNREKLFLDTPDPWFSGNVKIPENPHILGDEYNVHVLSPDVINFCLTNFDTIGDSVPFQAPLINQDLAKQIKNQYKNLIKDAFPQVQAIDHQDMADYIYDYHFIFPHKAEPLKVVYPAPGMPLWIGLLGEAMEIVGTDSIDRYMSTSEVLTAYQEDYNKNFGIGGTYHGDKEVVENGSEGELTKLPQISSVITPGMANPGSVQDTDNQIVNGSRSDTGTLASASRFRNAIKEAKDLREEKQNNFERKSKDKKRSKRVLNRVANFRSNFLSPLNSGGATVGGSSQFSSGNLLSNQNNNQAIKDRGSNQENTDLLVGAHFTSSEQKSDLSDFGYSSNNPYRNPGSTNPSGLSSYSQQNILDNISKQKHLYRSVDDDFLFIKVSKAYKRNLDRLFVRKKNSIGFKSPLEDKRENEKISNQKRKAIHDILEKNN